MSEHRTGGRAGSWKWVALVMGILLILMLTCAVSLLWGGMLGFALGRATSPQQTSFGPWSPYDFEPYLPEMPDGSGLPWLGVTYQMQENGALVTEVTAGSPAEEARLQAGDTIAEVDGRRVTEANPLGDIIQGYFPGDVVELTILRNGRERTVQVQLGERMGVPVPIEPGWGG